MKKIQILNATKGTCLGTEIRIADTFLLRLKGLLGAAELCRGEGLLLIPCSMVHGFGMRIAVEVLYLDQSKRVMKIHELVPGRCGPYVAGARWVLELPIGTVSHSCTELGDLLLSTRT